MTAAHPRTMPTNPTEATDQRPTPITDLRAVL
jgi:hypothetical protein